MSQSLLEQVENHRKDIKHEVLSYGLSEIVGMYRADPKEIVIQPDFQRLFRWSREQQSSFVESLILEVPIPPLFFFETDDGRWELLDGLQRVSTIVKFMGVDGDVPLEHQGDINNDNDWHEDNRNNIAVPLQLVATEYLSALDGLTYARMPTPLKLNLKRARLQIYVLKRETHSLYKYEVFKRLNTGGSVLADQELRNCAIRLLDNQFADFLRDIAKDVQFLAALAVSDDDVREAYPDELALRFFTMKNYSNYFKHEVADLLTKYMESVAKHSTTFDFEKESDIFRRTWAVLNRAITDGTAFRARRKDGQLAGPFSPTLFELLSLAIAWNLERAEALDSSALKAKLLTLADDARSTGLLGSGSNSRKKTQGRFSSARALFNT